MIISAYKIALPPSIQSTLNLKRFSYATIDEAVAALEGALNSAGMKYVVIYSDDATIFRNDEAEIARVTK